VTVLRVGLTGGIGAGKTVVSRRFAELGAVVIDADLVAREVVDVGTPGLAAVVERFGAGVLRGDRTLDREALARLVFHDDAARQDLNSIVHPLVRQRTAELIAAAPADAIVVNDVPLLVETGLAPAYDLVVVVSAPEDVRVERLRRRGMSEEEIRSRMRAQAGEDVRRAAADVVLDNSGSEESLTAQVDQLWATWRP
jgi:dephospho-CoA kinase